jgi:tetratricopeptide (TPR) repeat protein
VDGAAEELDNNLKMLYRDPDREAQEKSLYLLANLFYKRKNYQEVVRLLEFALRQYPDNPDAARSRYQLADSYRLLAGQHQQAFINSVQNPKTKDHYQALHRELLQKAADEFLVLARFLETPEGSNLLTLEERVQVPFTAAECCFNLGQYEKALQIYQHLAQRYPSDRIEGLNAMGGLVRCYAALGQAERLRETLATVQEVLPTFPPEIKQPWSDWLRVASKPLQD